MSNTPFGFGSRRSRRVDPFGFDPRQNTPLDPLFLDPSYSDLSFPRFGFGDDSAFAADACLDWKETREARVFKADLPGRHKRGVKVEVDRSAVQISGERTCKREKKADTRHLVEREKKIETSHRVEREKTTETWHHVEREKKAETWHRVEREKTTETWHRVESEKKTDTRPRVAREKKTDTRPRVAREKKTDSGEVLRRFRLPANVKAGQVKVAMENRMLTVTVPKEGVKKPSKKPSGKSIKISG